MYGVIVAIFGHVTLDRDLQERLHLCCASEPFGCLKFAVADTIVNVSKTAFLRFRSLAFVDALRPLVSLPERHKMMIADLDPRQDLLLVAVSD